MEFNYYTIIIGFFISIILYFKHPILQLKKPKKKYLVSIVIPVRNEENNIRKLLTSLKNQTYPIHEIICVNDHSTDKTSDVIKEFENVIEYIGKELPENWKGKPFACQQGAEAASGEVILFLDADVEVKSNAIETILGNYDGSTPLSIQPYHSMKKPYEYFSMFFNLIQVSATGLTVAGIKKPLGFYGPVLLINRDLFLQHGGYESVKNNVIEDYSLGRKYNKNNIFFDLFIGYKYVQFQMYPTSLNQVKEGWAKNFSKGSASAKFWVLISNIIWIGYYTAVPYELVKNIATANIYLSILLGLIYVYNVLLLYRTTKKIGNFPFISVVFFPIYLLFFYAVFVYSVLKTYIFRSNTWKGRKV